MKRLIYSCILVLSTSLSLMSCQYKDFDGYDGTVPVKVVVDYGRSNCVTKPSISRVVFYPLDSQSNTFTYDIRDSSTVSLPTGMLRVFAFNNTSEINRTRGMSDIQASPVIYTDKADYRGIYRTDSLDNTEYYDYPDVTYASWQTASISGNAQTTRDNDNRIVLPMQRVTKDVTIEVRGIRNASFVNGVRMSLSGIQKEYSPIEGYNHSYVSVVADGRVLTNDPDKGNRSAFDNKTVIDTLQASMNVFGIGPQRHILNVFLEGSNWHKTLSFDVTDQLQQQSEGMSVVLAVSIDYDVKSDVPKDNRFDIHVSDWDDKDILIQM